MTPLAHEPGILVNGEWRSIGGDELISHNPAHPDQVVWQGTPRASHVDDAVNAARRALPEWSAWPIERRCTVLRDFAEPRRQYDEHEQKGQMVPARQDVLYSKRHPPWAATCRNASDPHLS